MSINRHNNWSRREFLGTAALAGTGALLGLQSNSLAAEPPPETKKLRTTTSQTGICTQGPKIVAEALWRAEGF
ncbi:MAG: twin-arginine translocation signal domain-containing protein, partial [Candidatus Binatia bacterium]